MDAFNYCNNELFVEKVALRDIANCFGTPVFVYSKTTIEKQWREYDVACGERKHLVCFAVKANANLAVLNVLARLGAGFDIVSVGELERVLVAGGEPHKIVFSGVGKRIDELQRALEVGIRCFNVESIAEVDCLNHIAGAMGCIANIALRVNPDVDAGTHPYISTGLKENKFGIDMEQALTLYLHIAGLQNLHIAGIACHIGSQLTTITPFVDALQRVLALANKLEALGIKLKHIDLGGGLGIRYNKEIPIEPSEYIASLEQYLGNTNYELLLEPGRSIVGNAGVLLTKVLYLKETACKRFAIVDTAMNDLLRPALYQAVHKIVPVHKNTALKTQLWDLVGPVCESGDFLAKKRNLALQANDLLAIRGCGAYGFVMSSNYNSRPRAAEVMVDGKDMYLVRRREEVVDLFAGESMLP